MFMTRSRVDASARRCMGDGSDEAIRGNALFRVVARSARNRRGSLARITGTVNVGRVSAQERGHRSRMLSTLS